MRRSEWCLRSSPSVSALLERWCIGRRSVILTMWMRTLCYIPLRGRFMMLWYKWWVLQQLVKWFSSTWTSSWCHQCIGSPLQSEEQQLRWELEELPSGMASWIVKQDLLKVQHLDRITSAVIMGLSDFSSALETVEPWSLPVFMQRAFGQIANKVDEKKKAVTSMPPTLQMRNTHGRMARGHLNAIPPDDDSEEWQCGRLRGGVAGTDWRPPRGGEAIWICNCQKVSCFFKSHFDFGLVWDDLSKSVLFEVWRHELAVSNNKSFKQIDQWIISFVSPRQRTAGWRLMMTGFGDLAGQSGLARRGLNQ